MSTDIIARKRKILIVEDDHIFSRLYRHNVSQVDQQAEVFLAFDGYQALTLLATNVPDAVVLDIGMPSLDGCDFLRIVKTKSEFADLPIVVVTSSPDFYAEDVSRYPNTYLFRKPLTVKLLHTILSNILISGPATNLEVTSLAHLDRYIGPSTNFQRELVELFYESAPERIVELHRLLKLGNIELLEEWCHSMKGTASVLGANELRIRLEGLASSLRTTPCAIDLPSEVNKVTDSIRTAAVAFSRLLSDGKL